MVFYMESSVRNMMTKMHGVNYVKKLLEWMEWENVLLNSMQTIRTIK